MAPAVSASAQMAETCFCFSQSPPLPVASDITRFTLIYFQAGLFKWRISDVQLVKISVSMFASFAVAHFRS